MFKINSKGKNRLVERQKHKNRAIIHREYKTLLKRLKRSDNKMNEDRSLKSIMRTTLRKQKPEENIKDVDERIFNMEMAERLDNEAMEIIKVLKELKKEFEEELKCKKNK
jgi:hypothetical protein